MLEEFLTEENQAIHIGVQDFPLLGIKVFPKEMENAIRNGNEESLAHVLSNPAYWQYQKLI